MQGYIYNMLTLGGVKEVTTLIISKVLTNKLTKC